jgi:hypothetical protein
MMTQKSVKNFLIIFFLGISGDLPLALILSTLKALLLDKGFDLKTIGFFSLISLPYTLKFCFAPIIDSCSIPFLTKFVGQRKSWIILSQIFLVIFIALLGVSGISGNIGVIAIFALYIFVALNWSYSTGERAGFLQKVSNKGWICKTWEGELSLVAMPGAAPEKFLFTVRDEAIAQKISAAAGKRVTLNYEQHKGLPTSCFGDTDYFVTGVTEIE